MFMTLAIIATVPLLLGVITIYIAYINSAEQSARAYSHQIMEQMNIHLNRSIYDYAKLTTVALYDTNVMEILRNHSGPYQSSIYTSAAEKSKMNLFISSLSFEKPEIVGIRILAMDGSIFGSADEKQSDHWLYEEHPWLKRVVAEDGEFVIIPPYEINYYSIRKARVFSVARLLREPYTLRPLAVATIDINSSLIFGNLESVTFSKNSKLLITNHNGDIFYPNKAVDFTLPADLRDNGLIDLQGETYLSVLRESSDETLNIIGLIPVSDLRKNAQVLFEYTLLISVIALLIAYLLAYFGARNLIKPIKHLQFKMKKIQIGLFGERIEIRSKDEIGDLMNGFNSMVTEIERLIKENLEIGLREREAELSALQSQMNPHFLYNTLENINMMALEQSHFEISGVVSSLGKLIRYTVNNKVMFVPLNEELRFLEAYMKICATRIGAGLIWRMHVDPILKTSIIPKLIIQPLVENAVQHGIRQQPGCIDLNIYQEDGTLYIAVSDDGVGMSAEKKLELIQRIGLPANPQQGKKESFGGPIKGNALWNVNQRIKLLYGPQFGLFIDQDSDIGSRFMIQLPVRLEEIE
ncbi:sensor histidine kinase [Paenibacillus thalictri]|nr:sensor histidine kinase [Paenibacillus thalictri]